MSKLRETDGVYTWRVDDMRVKQHESKIFRDPCEMNIKLIHTLTFPCPCRLRDAVVTLLVVLLTGGGGTSTGGA